jgi:hypothetical protein
MKKIIITISLFCTLAKSEAQIYIPPQFIPIIFSPSSTWFNVTNTNTVPQYLPFIMWPLPITDTLQWMQTHIQGQSAHFSGKPLSVIFDSLYMLKMLIAEYNPPLNIRATSMTVGPQRWHNKDTLFVDSLTFYLAPISDGGAVYQIHETAAWNNLKNHTNILTNTHVKYFKVVFQQSIPYLRSIADSKNGRREWTPFVEYFWGGRIVQRVTVGEY